MKLSSAKCRTFSWWRHQMKTFSALLDICAGNSPVPGEFPIHKGQWRGALMFSLICARINGWVNNREAGDFRCHRAHYDVIVMCLGLDVAYVHLKDPHAELRLTIEVLFVIDVSGTLLRVMSCCLTAPSHYLNQCWRIVNWTLRNKRQLNVSPNSNFFIEDYAFQNAACKMTPILFT